MGASSTEFCPYSMSPFFSEHFPYFLAQDDVVGSSCVTDELSAFINPDKVSQSISEPIIVIFEYELIYILTI